MFTYTIGFIRQGNNILMLNREKSEWMGIWNGVGGKIAAGETPHECILREIKEETGIELEKDSLTYKGDVTWTNPEGSYYGGMHAFIAYLPEDYVYPTPIKTVEGILDWKDLAWILHPENVGIANLKYFLTVLFDEEKIYQHNFIYDGQEVQDFYSKLIQEPLISQGNK